mmetsp:Transcript_24346/g.80955  ORF Transcript_24346/g.80955 Transcript_24346/m.80955 type:complete len:266 (-) Transcript_24346:1537-2334(-)
MREKRAFCCRSCARDSFIFSASDAAFASCSFLSSACCACQRSSSRSRSPSRRARSRWSCRLPMDSSRFSNSCRSSISSIFCSRISSLRSFSASLSTSVSTLPPPSPHPFFLATFIVLRCSAICSASFRRSAASASSRVRFSRSASRRSASACSRAFSSSSSARWRCALSRLFSLSSSMASRSCSSLRRSMTSRRARTFWCSSSRLLPIASCSRARVSEACFSRSADRRCWLTASRAEAKPASDSRTSDEAAASALLRCWLSCPSL